MKKIGIIGLGMMGGSIAKALKRSKVVEEIIAYDVKEESLSQAKKEGVIDKITKEIDQSFSNIDIIFICTPVKYIPQYVKKLEKIVKKDCIITDIGSTKKEIMQGICDINVHFIGGHPMVGSERSSYETSTDFLFENSYYILIAEDKENKFVKELKKIIEQLKAIPIIIDAEKHDHVVAAISHVPHIIASGIVNMVKQMDDEKESMKTLAAGGFKDITRIASSNPVMWEQICQENKSEIKSVLKKYINILIEFEKNMEQPKQIYEYFSGAKQYRDSFINKKIDGNFLPAITVKIRDEKGAIAKIAGILAKANINIKNIGIVNNRETNDGALHISFENYKEQEKAFEILKERQYEMDKII